MVQKDNICSNNPYPFEELKVTLIAVVKIIVEEILHAVI
jgi:hypothetical protein